MPPELFLTVRGLVESPTIKRKLQLIMNRILVGDFKVQTKNYCNQEQMSCDDDDIVKIMLKYRAWMEV